MARVLSNSDEVEKDSSPTLFRGVSSLVMHI
jgi:hypothetical protein